MRPVLPQQQTSARSPRPLSANSGHTYRCTPRLTGIVFGFILVALFFGFGS